MMIRGMLFLLFLYTLLVWIVSFYLDGEEVVQRGLFWTAVGVAGLLAWLIFERIFGWWRLRQARTAAKPVGAVPQQTSKVSHPDDVAFRQLIDEANLRLAQADTMKDRGGRAGATIFDLPMFLVVGAEGAGKTSVVQHSGIEPHLLAGQAVGAGAAAMATRSANIWLAKGMIYVEISGRIFGGELARFTEWLQELAPKQQLSGLEAKLARTRLGGLFHAAQKPGNLRGVILVSDVREFVGTPEMSKLDRAAGLVRERLDAIGGHFGVACPVYLLFSRTDQVLYFKEFFARMSESEAAQVFGALTATGETHGAEQVWAEAETRRLNRYFNQIFLRLADRRLSALTTEPQMQARPAVYEFPREFKRVRTGMVQYLVDIFRPNPLKAPPQLRGFFFTGTRLVERAAAGPRGGEAKPAGNLEATQIFKPGVTEIFGRGESPAIGRSEPAGAMVPGWMFLSELFHKVLPRDRPVLVAAVAPVSSAPGWSKIAVGVAAAAGVLAAMVWSVSWMDNRRWINEATEQIERMRATPNRLSAASLEPVDELRKTLERIEADQTLRPHWGLYSGDDVVRIGQEAYFKRVKELFLEGANVSLVSSFVQPGEALKSSLYDRVKTHVTITSKACAVNEPLVRNVLQQAVMELQPGLDAKTAGLVRNQLAYYAKVLHTAEETPVRLAPSPSLAATQAKLRTSGGLEAQLSSFLEAAGKDLPAIRVSDRVPDYAKVLSGQGEVEARFTQPAARRMEELISGAKSSAGEECVTGAGESVLASMTSDNKKQLTEMYYLRYADAWHAFLKSYQVLRFNSRQDAAAKLDLLTRPQSPLLMVVKMVAENTDFPEKAGEKSQWDAAAETAKNLGLGGLLSPITNAGKKAEKAQAKVEKVLAGPPGLTAHDVTRLMQPVHVTTPPKSDVLKSEANAPYIDGLRGLQKVIDSMARASEADMVALIPQGQEALATAKAGLRGLADRFADTGNQGLNLELEALLEQPIRLADAVLPHNQTVFSAGKINSDLGAMCRAIAPVMSKFPFNLNSSVDAPLAEVARAFGPATGLVWQFQAGSLAEVVVKEGSEWKAAKPKPGVAAGLLNFLNRSQQFVEAIYPEGKATAPRFTFLLRAAQLPSVPAWRQVRLDLDGKIIDTKESALQMEFSWPATGVAKAEGAAVSNDGSQAPFGSYLGPWAAVRLFQNADAREMHERDVKWSSARGAGATAVVQAIVPPGRVQIARFPGNNVDLFNPRFFEGLRCPSQAVLPE